MTTRKKPARKPAKSAPKKLQNCAGCHKEMSEPSEWMRSKNKYYCAACYQGLLFPNRKLGSQEIID